MAETKTLWAPVKWAQRKDALYVTVDLPDVKDEKVTLSTTNLTFTYVCFLGGFGAFVSKGYAL